METQQTIVFEEEATVAGKTLSMKGGCVALATLAVAQRNVFQRCFVWCNTLGLFVYPSAYISSDGQQSPQLPSQLI
jgi:hypothetical protein